MSNGESVWHQPAYNSRVFKSSVDSFLRLKKDFIVRKNPSRIRKREELESISENDIGEIVSKKETLPEEVFEKELCFEVDLWAQVLEDETNEQEKFGFPGNKKIEHELKKFKLNKD